MRNYLRSINAGMTLATGICVGVSLGIPVGWALAAPEHAARSSVVVQEDEPGFDCTRDGNRICGPDNEAGKTAGCYADTGVLMSVWPCRIIVRADGNADVYNDGPAR